MLYKTFCTPGREVLQYCMDVALTLTFLPSKDRNPRSMDGGTTTLSQEYSSWQGHYTLPLVNSLYLGWAPDTC